MTKVLGVSVSDKASLPALSQPAAGEKDAGSSAAGFTFVGQYKDGNGYTVAVGLANGPLDAKNCSVNPAGDGGIFPFGSDGQYALVHTDNTDATNYTVGESSDKDADGTSVIFIAGGGGPGLAAK